MMVAVLSVVQLVLVGLLAGEEFIVRYGVQPSISALPDHAHVLARIALVKRLKVVVPALMVPTVLASIAALGAEGASAGLWWRVAALVALVAFMLFSFLGTVPINIKVNDWDADQPPVDWRDLARRGENIDTFRSSAAILALILSAIAVS